MRPTVSVRGGLPTAIKNDFDLYEGNLVHYFQVVFNNAKNLQNPYHNFRHLTHVFFMCHEACKFYVNRLSKREMRALLISALFHDYDHTGKTGADSVNIELALTGVRKYLLESDADLLPDIEETIRMTEFPYKVRSEDIHLEAQILRDADMSQALSVAWIQQVVFGLAAEWDMSPLDVLMKQPLFHANTKFFTDWAKQEFPQSEIRQKIEEARELIEILVGEPELVTNM